MRSRVGNRNPSFGGMALAFPSVGGRPPSRRPVHVAAGYTRLGAAMHARAGPAAALVGFRSGAALAIVVGVLVELPVVLSVVRIVRTRQPVG